MKSGPSLVVRRGGAVGEIQSRSATSAAYENVSTWSSCAAPLGNPASTCSHSLSHGTASAGGKYARCALSMFAAASERVILSVSAASFAMGMPAEPAEYTNVESWNV